jgi:hypothetical protein
MNFDGWTRAWLALRVADVGGWRLRQDIDAPRAAVFGVRERAGVQHLALAVPLAPGEQEPRSAALLMRAPNAALVEPSLPARVAFGLEAGAPQAGRTLLLRSARRVPRCGRSRAVVFTFPDSAFDLLIALDPRESVVVELDGERLLIEVGDIAAARGFLTLRR